MTQRDDVLRTYHQEVARRGQRGAYGRTGKIHGISDETVRRYAHAEEQEDTLDYVPPPGGYPTPEPLANMPHRDEDATQDATETPEGTTAPTGDATAPVQEDATSQATRATYGTYEPGIVYRWWITCVHHMDVVQLVVGIVIVWLLVQVL